MKPERRFVAREDRCCRLTRWILLSLLVFAAYAGAAVGPAWSIAIERASVSSAEVEGNDCSGSPSVSAEGGYVAFNSDASNLVAGDTNLARDVFVRDRVTGTTERVSVSSAGVEGNEISEYPSISADGRYVAFCSHASNLVGNDDNGAWDIFVRDRDSGDTERVSVSSTGAEGNGDSRFPAISADGRYVAFFSYATNLVGGDANGASDVFLRDRATGETERVSVSSDEVEGNDESAYHSSISADGRYVAFCSAASNLVAGDTNDARDIFVRDRVTGDTERVSVSSADQEASAWSEWPSISADGRYVAFFSIAGDLVAGDNNGDYDVFVRDRVTGETERASVSSAEEGATGSHPSISADGRYVVFQSGSELLVAGDSNGASDVFLRDRATGETERVSVSSAGNEGAGDSYVPSVSADGRFVAFFSCAANLTEGDANDQPDVFVRDRGFPDVPSDHWARDEIMACFNASIVSGYGDGLYHPELAVTRDQMAVYISRALAGGDENVPDFTGTPTFPDVPAGFWALKYVEYAVSQNVVAGYQDGNYHPGYQVTRDQMAVYVARSICDPTGEDGLADYVPADPRNFPDVASDHWAYRHIEYCVENGVVSGYLDGSYHPEGVVTRDQMAVYVARAFGLME